MCVKSGLRLYNTTYKEAMKLIEARNKQGLCIHTGTENCPYITADECCFLCLDPHEAEKLRSKNATSNG